VATARITPVPPRGHAPNPTFHPAPPLSSPTSLPPHHAHAAPLPPRPTALHHSPAPPEPDPAPEKTNATGLYLWQPRAAVLPSDPLLRRRHATMENDGAPVDGGEGSDFGDFQG
jgi:hypothetical protein